MGIYVQTMTQSLHNLVICLAGRKGKYDVVGRKWEVITLAWLLLCICSLLGFNAFCQILNFTTKCLIMLWHSASGKCTGLESAPVTLSQWKHTLKNHRLHSLHRKLVTHIFKQAKRWSNSST